MRPATVVLLALLGSSGTAVAQSTPPDLAPKLTGAPLAGKQTAPDEKPRLKEPPRPPAVPDTLAPTTAAPAASAPTR